MLFNSFQYLLFFPTVILIYFLMPYRTRNSFLLAASCVFYMALIPAYLLILALVVVVDYTAAFLIAGSKGKKRKVYLAASLITNLGLLAFFKYSGFAYENISHLAGFLGWTLADFHWKYTIPLGLSFHTFQAMSYTIEVFRGRQKPEKNFVTYSLFVMFFPQLVAGPIERPQNLLHQFREKHDFKYDDVVSGLRLILWGLIKK